MVAYSPCTMTLPQAMGLMWGGVEHQIWEGSSSPFYESYASSVWPWSPTKSSASNDSIAGSEVLSTSGMEKVNSYSELPMGLFKSRRAYSASTFFLSWYGINPMQAESCVTFSVHRCYKNDSLLKGLRSAIPCYSHYLVSVHK